MSIFSIFKRKSTIETEIVSDADFIGHDYLRSSCFECPVCGNHLWKDTKICGACGVGLVWHLSIDYDMSRKVWVKDQDRDVDPK